MAQSDIVLQLKAKPFGSLTYEEKLLVIKDGRPCPPLKNLTSAVIERKKSYIRHFNVSNYECYNWLCGTESLLKLFCWPCLLFSPIFVKNIWVSSGFSNLSGLSKSARAHESSESHLQCVVDLYNFGKQRVDEGIDRTLKVNNAIHNQKVKKHREILKRLIDVTCFLAKQELPFRGHDETETSLNKGNYIETLNLLKIWDPVLADHFEMASVFKGTSSDIQNDLISTISDVVEEAIFKEIQAADFVAIMLHETSDVKSRSQLSTVIRYVNKDDNCIKERFVGFSDVSADRTADALLSHVKDIVNKYDLASKFIAQTYDGAAVMSGHLSGLQKKVLDTYPNALFTHCYAHILNLVLAQGMNDIPECNIFFSTLNGISTFSSHSSKRSFAVQEHLKKTIPSFVPTRWSFTSRLVNTVETYRESIINFFSGIYENSDDNWKGPDRCAAYGYVEFLKKFETVFLLNLFSPLFAQSDVLFQILQTENIDIVTCLNYLRDFQQLLRNERQGVKHCDDCEKKFGHATILKLDSCDKCETLGFQLLWEKTVSMVGLPSKSRKRRHDKDDVIDGLTPEQKYRRLFFSVIDNLIGHLSFRFSSLQNLTFFDLLNPRKFKTFSQKTSFPESLLIDVEHTYPGLFDLNGLRNELHVFYRTTTFHEKVPHTLLKFLRDEKLDLAFKEVFRLAKLISTIPATTSSVERSFSALKRIHTYKRSTQTEERMTSLALLSIEREILASLRDSEDFYNIVINKFASKTRRLDFIYK